MCKERDLYCSPRKPSEKQQLRCFLRQQAVGRPRSRGWALGEKEGGEEAEGKWFFMLVVWLQAETLPGACVRDSADRLGM